MNVFKAKSLDLRRGFWMDSYSNRQIKKQCRRKARYTLKNDMRKENDR